LPQIQHKLSDFHEIIDRAVDAHARAGYPSEGRRRMSSESQHGSPSAGRRASNYVNEQNLQNLAPSSGVVRTSFRIGPEERSPADAAGFASASFEISAQPQFATWSPYIDSARAGDGSHQRQ
jgi:hypothetical protein